LGSTKHGPGLGAGTSGAIAEDFPHAFWVCRQFGPFFPRRREVAIRNFRQRSLHMSVSETATTV
jgi:hypothetical protein